MIISLQKRVLYFKFLFYNLPVMQIFWVQYFTVWLKCSTDNKAIIKRKAISVRYNGNLAIYTFSDKCYYDTMPLKSFFELLDPNDCFHTSRQTIVHRDAVRSIIPSKTKKGGLDVSLTIETDIHVEVSARNVARFKEWLAAGNPPPARKPSIPVPMLF